MVRQSILLVILFVFSVSGCVSICAEKVYVEGNPSQCKISAKSAAQEGPTGIIKKADNWVKENLW